MTLIIDEKSQQFINSECIPKSSSYEEDLEEIKRNILKTKEQK